MEEIIRNWAKTWGKEIKIYEETENFIWFTYTCNYISKRNCQILEEMTGAEIDSIEASQNALNIWLTK